MKNVILTIVGAALLVAIGVPVLGLFTRASDGRGKQKRTMGDMRSVATAMESYSVDAKAYPATTDLDELARLVEPTYIKKLPRKDGWGSPLVLVSTPREYTIRSHGRDREPDGVGKTGTIAPNGGTTTYDADLVFNTGSFVQFPDGTMQ